MGSMPATLMGALQGVSPASGRVGVGQYDFPIATNRVIGPPMMPGNLGGRNVFSDLAVVGRQGAGNPPGLYDSRRAFTAKVQSAGGGGSNTAIDETVTLASDASALQGETSDKLIAQVTGYMLVSGGLPANYASIGEFISNVSQFCKVTIKQGANVQHQFFLDKAIKTEFIRGGLDLIIIPDPANYNATTLRLEVDAGVVNDPPSGTDLSWQVRLGFNWVNKGEFVARARAAGQLR